MLLKLQNSFNNQLKLFKMFNKARHLMVYSINHALSLAINNKIMFVILLTNAKRKSSAQSMRIYIMLSSATIMRYLTVSSLYTGYDQYIV